MNRSSRSIRQLIMAALFASLLAVSGQIIIPMVPAPITMQTFVVMLCGLLLGPALGITSISVFILLVALGAPLLAGGSGGVGVLFGPTGGFIWSWLFAVLVIGLLTRKISNHTELKLWHLIVVNMVGGIFVVYVIGVPWLMEFTQLSYNLPNLVAACFIFLPGDLIKCVAAAFLARSLYRIDPTLRHVHKG